MGVLEFCFLRLSKRECFLFFLWPPPSSPNVLPTLCSIVSPPPPRLTNPLLNVPFSPRGPRLSLKTSPRSFSPSFCCASAHPPVFFPSPPTSSAFLLRNTPNTCHPVRALSRLAWSPLLLFRQKLCFSDCILMTDFPLQFFLGDLVFPENSPFFRSMRPGYAKIRGEIFWLRGTTSSRLVLCGSRSTLPPETFFHSPFFFLSAVFFANP